MAFAWFIGTVTFTPTPTHAGNFQFALDETTDTSKLQQVGFVTNVKEKLEGAITTRLGSINS